MDMVILDIDMLRFLAYNSGSDQLESTLIITSNRNRPSDDICLDTLPLEEIWLDTLRPEGKCPDTPRPKGRCCATRRPDDICFDNLGPEEICRDILRPEGKCPDSPRPDGRCPGICMSFGTACALTCVARAQTISSCQVASVRLVRMQHPDPEFFS